jgi:Xaa-Pro aminopeptidase
LHDPQCSRDRSISNSGRAPRRRHPEAAEEHIRTLNGPDEVSFVAHGIGLRSHEVPHLSTNAPPYPISHRDRPLASGMVLSLETQVTHPSAGYIKLEDAIIVTDDGFDALADSGRG